MVSSEMMVVQQKSKTFVICKVQQGHQMWRAGAVVPGGGEPGVGGTWGSTVEHGGWVLWALNTYMKPLNMEGGWWHYMVGYGGGTVKHGGRVVVLCSGRR
jgi:hypothetical protein